MLQLFQQENSSTLTHNKSITILHNQNLEYPFNFASRWFSEQTASKKSYVQSWKPCPRVLMPSEENRFFVTTPCKPQTLQVLPKPSHNYCHFVNWQAICVVQDGGNSYTQSRYNQYHYNSVFQQTIIWSSTSQCDENAPSICHEDLINSSFSFVILPSV